ncbi:flagellar protein FlaG [Nitrosomonas sp.]|uniref:flagellar protein FlaG n=1 Tax=Nitrosomonas sp. TaxID=42353 RepID=UPI0025E9F6DF|nr:flagellar protein FlaG [Nitrosomonas sp.]MCC6916200.1 flagellar protein FlaG [Nitrosomonas sp.]
MNINVMTADMFQTVAPVQPAMPAARTGEREMAPAVQPAAKTGDIKPEQVKEAVDQIQQFTQTLTQNLKFSIDEDTGKMVIKIVDAQTQEVIRQMPSEEAIKIASALGKIQGLLFNGQA